MGIFDFVREAGEALGGKVFDMVNDKNVDDTASSLSAEQLNEIRQANIMRKVSNLDVIVTDFAASVDGEQVTITGKVADQASCEKIVLAAGNQAGIAKVDCQIDVQNPEPESVMYTVKSGDTLSKIAKEHLGDAMAYMKIFEANQPMLTDPNKIQVGQTLRIPKA